MPYLARQVVAAQLPLSAESSSLVSPSSGSPRVAAGAEAESFDEAVSLLQQRLQQLQLQRNAFGADDSSLLGRASVLAAVQPCAFTLSVVRCATLKRTTDAAEALASAHARRVSTALLRAGSDARSGHGSAAR
eukprot:1313786-Pleurochrysis_carterae.AAC.2